MQCYRCERRHLAPIWALLSPCNAKHILESKQKKWHSSLLVFAHLLCIEICQNNPRAHESTQYLKKKKIGNEYEHSFKLI